MKFKYLSKPDSEKWKFFTKWRQSSSPAKTVNSP
jgi:hypothetical protein